MKCFWLNTNMHFLGNVLSVYTVDSDICRSTVHMKHTVDHGIGFYVNNDSNSRKLLLLAARLLG